MVYLLALPLPAVDGAATFQFILSRFVATAWGILLPIISALVQWDWNILIPKNLHSVVWIAFDICALSSSVIAGLTMEAARRGQSRRWRRRHVFTLAATAFLLVLPFVAQVTSGGRIEYGPLLDFRDAGVGYHVWWASHLVLAAGLWVKPVRRASEAVGAV